MLFRSVLSIKPYAKINYPDFFCGFIDSRENILPENIKELESSNDKVEFMTPENNEGFIVICHHTDFDTGLLSDNFRVIDDSNCIDITKYFIEYPDRETYMDIFVNNEGITTAAYACYVYEIMDCSEEIPISVKRITRG